MKTHMLTLFDHTGQAHAAKRCSVCRRINATFKCSYCGTRYCDTACQTVGMRMGHGPRCLATPAKWLAYFREYLVGNLELQLATTAAYREISAASDPSKAFGFQDAFRVVRDGSANFSSMDASALEYIANRSGTLMIVPTSLALSFHHSSSNLTTFAAKWSSSFQEEARKMMKASNVPDCMVLDLDFERTQHSNLMYIEVTPIETFSEFLATHDGANAPLTMYVFGMYSASLPPMDDTSLVVQSIAGRTRLSLDVGVVAHVGYYHTFGLIFAMGKAFLVQAVDGVYGFTCWLDFDKPLVHNQALGEYRIPGGYKVVPRPESRVVMPSGELFAKLATALDTLCSATAKDCARNKAFEWITGVTVERPLERMRVAVARANLDALA